MAMRDPEVVDPDVMAALEALGQAVAALDHKFDRKFGELDAKIDRRCDALDAKIDQVLDLLLGRRDT